MTADQSSGFSCDVGGLEQQCTAGGGEDPVFERR